MVKLCDVATRAQALSEGVNRHIEAEGKVDVEAVRALASAVSMLSAATGFLSMQVEFSVIMLEAYATALNNEAPHEGRQQAMNENLEWIRKTSKLDMAKYNALTPPDWQKWISEQLRNFHEGTNDTPHSSDTGNTDSQPD